jgi:tyrosine-protein phosphatase YwqE
MGVAGFVDIHCHLIAGIDDGPKDDKQTRALLDAARAAGVAAIVATPHCSSRYSLDAADRDARFAAAEAMANDTPLRFSGCELELSEERL